MNESDPHKGVISLARNFAHLFSARLLTKIGRALYVVILARSLGPELYALLAYGQAWYLAFLPLALFGLAGVLSREIGGRRGSTEKIVGRALLVSASANLTAAVASITLGWLFADSAEVFTLIAIMTVAMIGRSAAMFFNQVFIATENSKYVLAQEAVFRAIEIFSGLAVLALGGGLYGVAIIHAGVWWAYALRGFSIMYYRLGIKVTYDRDLKACLLIGKTAIPFLIFGILTNWLLQGPVILFREACADPVVTGNFALAMQVLLLVVAFPQALSSVALPVVSRAASRRDGKDAVFVSVMIRAALIIGCVAGMVGDAIGPWLVSIVFGDSFKGTGSILGYVLWCVSPLIVVFAVPQTLYARHDNTVAIWASGTGVILLTTMLAPLENRFELLGGVYAVMIALSSSALVMLAICVRRALISVTGDLIRPGVAVLSAYLAFTAARSTGAMVALGLGLLVLLAMIFVARVVDKEELKGSLRIFIKGREKP